MALYKACQGFGSRPQCLQGSKVGSGWVAARLTYLLARRQACLPQAGRKQAYRAARLRKLKPNRPAETMPIAGPGSAPFIRDLSSAYPAPTAMTLATDDAQRKCENLVVNCRPVAAGMISRALASSAPMKRSPANTVRLKTKRK